jgi:hypothetical protein
LLGKRFERISKFQPQRDQRKQARLQWLQEPSEINGDNLNNVRREASRYFRHKKNDKINELAVNSKKQEHQRPVYGNKLI